MPAALAFIQAGRPREMTWALCGVVALGAAFVGWKLYEYHLDFVGHFWVNDPDFPIKGELEGGAKLFWAFYWIATVLHAAHMTIAMGLVAYIIRRALRGDFSRPVPRAGRGDRPVLELRRYRLDGALAADLPDGEDADGENT